MTIFHITTGQLCHASSMEAVEGTHLRSLRNGMPWGFLAGCHFPSPAPIYPHPDEYSACILQPGVWIGCFLFFILKTYCCPGWKGLFMRICSWEFLCIIGFCLFVFNYDPSPEDNIYFTVSHNVLSMCPGWLLLSVSQEFKVCLPLLSLCSNSKTDVGSY